MFTVWGGKIGPEIKSLTIHGQLPVPDAVIPRNRAHTKTLGLPTYKEWPKAKSASLAVIGGGPSIKDHVEEIRAFDGDIWAINGAWGWCRDNDIQATFFAVDPHPIVAKWAEGAKRALIDSCCDPMVFEVLAQANVATFECGPEDRLNCAGMSVTTTPQLACRFGYRKVTLYGCESCFTGGVSHAYQHEERDDQLIVKCGDNYYLTATDFFMQAGVLAEFIRAVPEFITERSGGLLRAMIATKGEYGIRWVSQPLAQGLWAEGQEPKMPPPPPDEPYLPLNWNAA